MKKTYVKMITVVGLLAVLLLQTIWIFNAYKLAKEELYKKGIVILQDALYASVHSRMEKIDLPKGIYKENQTIKMSHLNQILDSLGYPFSLEFIDSTYISLAQKAGLTIDVSLSVISNDSGTLKSTKKLGAWYLIVPEKVYTKEDKSEYLQVAILNPYKDIFTKMGLILIATVIMAFIIIYCISYQIKIINRQNKIAQLRSDFSNAMVHDMKTPLASIIMGNKALESGKLDAEKAKNYHKIVNNEAEKLSMLADKVLTMAKIEQTSLDLNKQIISARVIIDSLVEVFAAKAAKEICFITDYKAEEIYADHDFIKQVISNLIDNAIKYSGDPVTIRITVEEDNNFTRIKVKDNGFGIPHKDQLKIFEKFERASATKRSSKGGATGFGIGLSYVQQVINAHEGTIAIQSIEGEYSEFTINLPKLTQEIYDKIVTGGRRP